MARKHKPAKHLHTENHSNGLEIEVWRTESGGREYIVKLSGQFICDRDNYGEALEIGTDAAFETLRKAA